MCTASVHATLRWLERVEGVGVTGLAQRLGCGFESPAVLDELQRSGIDLKAAAGRVAAHAQIYDATADGRHTTPECQIVMSNDTVVTVLSLPRQRRKPHRRPKVIAAEHRVRGKLGRVTRRSIGSLS